MRFPEINPSRKNRNFGAKIETCVLKSQDLDEFSTRIVLVCGSCKRHGGFSRMQSTALLITHEIKSEKNANNRTRKAMLTKKL